jgi:hypothetical protein
MRFLQPRGTVIPVTTITTQLTAAKYLLLSNEIYFYLNRHKKTQKKKADTGAQEMLILYTEFPTIP